MTAQPPPALGIDPGKTGGAVLLDQDGRSMLAAWSWCPSGEGETAGYSLSSAVDDQYSVGDWRSALVRVGDQIASDVRRTLGEAPDVVLCCEGLFVDPRWPATAIALAEATGALLDPLLALASGEVLRPLASTWRPAVLRIPASTPAAQAEAAALRAIRAGLVRGLSELENGHVAEAACLALYAWSQARGSVQLELASGRRR